MPLQWFKATAEVIYALSNLIQQHVLISHMQPSQNDTHVPSTADKGMIISQMLFTST